MPDPENDVVDDQLKRRSPMDEVLGLPPKIASPTGTPGVIGVPPINHQWPTSPTPPTADKTPMGAPIVPQNPHVAEAQRMEDTGSGVQQVQAKHPFWGGVLRGLDTAASIIAPPIAAAIPGTTLHHNMLIGQQEHLANEDVGREREQAQTAEIQQKPQMEQAVLQHQDDLEAQKEAARQAQQVQAQKEQQSRLDEQLQQGQDVADQREEVADANRQSSENKADQRFALQEKNADRRAASVGNVGTWQMAEDDQGKPILYNSKTGETKAAPANLRPKGTFSKTMAPAEDAKNYAVSYLQNGTFTGPGDEALQEKFFELAKPSTGFRMTQPQIEQLQAGRNWMNSVEGHLYHATHGTWFSDQQRKEIVDTMNQLAAAKEHPQGGVDAGPKPGDVEGGYKFKGGNPADPKSWEKAQ